MKKIILIILMSTKALASQVECVEAVKEFNKKYKGESEFSFLDFKENGSPLFMRHKVGIKNDTAKQAKSNEIVRLCIKAGFSNHIYTGDLGLNKPKYVCSVVNLNTMGAVCDKYTGTNDKVIEMK